MTFDDDAPLSLEEACSDVLRGFATPSTLRAAIHAGTLAAERIGRRYIVTPASIREWRKTCRVEQKVRVSGSSQPGSTPKEPRSSAPSGASEMERSNVAQAAAKLRIEKLKSISRNTSSPSTPRPQIAIAARQR